MNIASAPSFDNSTSSVPSLRHRSVWALVGLFVITLHCYALYWYIDTTRALNRRGTVKISGGFMALCVGVSLVSAALYFAVKVLGAENLAEWIPTTSWALRVGSGALWLAWTLRLRQQLNAQLLSVGRPELSASLLWSWLFQMFYLQLTINRIVDDRLIRGASPL